MKKINLNRGSLSSKVIGKTKLPYQVKVSLWGVHGGEREAKIQRRDWEVCDVAHHPLSHIEFKEKDWAEGDRFPKEELPPPPILNHSGLKASVTKGEGEVEETRRAKESSK